MYLAAQDYIQGELNVGAVPNAHVGPGIPLIMALSTGPLRRRWHLRMEGWGLRQWWGGASHNVDYGVTLNGVQVQALVVPMQLVLISERWAQDLRTGWEFLSVPDNTGELFYLSRLGNLPAILIDDGVYSLMENIDFDRGAYMRLEMAPF